MEPGRKDITDAINGYRECARHIWNCHYRQLQTPETMSDLRDEFEDVCVQLFGSLVLRAISRESFSKTPSYMSRLEPLDFLRVVLVSETHIPVHINREPVPSGYWDYPIQTLDRADCDLRFLDLFDFGVHGFRNMEFCRVRIVASVKHPDVVGRDALVNAGHVRFEVVEAEGKPDSVGSTEPAP